MEGKSIGITSFEETLSAKVGSFLRAKGYDLATSIGIAQHPVTTSDCLGILYRHPEFKTKKYFFGLFRREPKKLFLGTIWFDNQLRKATAGRWAIEANYKGYENRIKKISEELKEEFQVEISLIPSENNPLFFFENSTSDLNPF